MISLLLNDLPSAEESDMSCRDWPDWRDLVRLAKSRHDGHFHVTLLDPYKTGGAWRGRVATPRLHSLPRPCPVMEDPRAFPDVVPISALAERAQGFESPCRTMPCLIIFTCHIIYGVVSMIIIMSNKRFEL